MGFLLAQRVGAPQLGAAVGPLALVGIVVLGLRIREVADGILPGESRD